MNLGFVFSSLTVTTLVVPEEKLSEDVFEVVFRNSPFRSRHKSRLSHVNIILRHYGGQLKTAIEQEVGKKTVKDDKKSGKEIRI